MLNWCVPWLFDNLLRNDFDWTQAGPMFTVFGPTQPGNWTRNTTVMPPPAVDDMIMTNTWMIFVLNCTLHDARVFSLKLWSNVNQFKCNRLNSNQLKLRKCIKGASICGSFLFLTSFFSLLILTLVASAQYEPQSDNRTNSNGEIWTQPNLCQPTEQTSTISKREY